MAVATSASAQLRPPEVRGLRGAQFPSMNPPPDVRSFGEGPAPDGRRRRHPAIARGHVHEQGLLQGSVRCGATSATGDAIPRQIADMRSGGAGSATSDPRIGAKPPGTARWGDCKMDWPRENIVSPYRDKTAKEHYQALVADAKRRAANQAHLRQCRSGTGPTASTPNGRRVWNYSRANQVPTLSSLLTPDYQQRMARHMYREGVNAAHSGPVLLLAGRVHAAVGHGPEAEPRDRHSSGRDVHRAAAATTCGGSSI